MEVNYNELVDAIQFLLQQGVVDRDQALDLIPALDNAAGDAREEEKVEVSETVHLLMRALDEAYERQFGDD